MATMDRRGAKVTSRGPPGFWTLLWPRAGEGFPGLINEVEEKRIVTGRRRHPLDLEDRGSPGILVGQGDGKANCNVCDARLTAVLPTCGGMVNHCRNPLSDTARPHSLSVAGRARTTMLACPGGLETPATQRFEAPWPACERLFFWQKQGTEAAGLCAS